MMRVPRAACVPMSTAEEWCAVRRQAQRQRVVRDFHIRDMPDHARRERRMLTRAYIQNGKRAGRDFAGSRRKR